MVAAETKQVDCSVSIEDDDHFCLSADIFLGHAQRQKTTLACLLVGTQQKPPIRH